jgi:hypothetical protein
MLTYYQLVQKSFQAIEAIKYAKSVGAAITYGGSTEWKSVLI